MAQKVWCWLLTVHVVVAVFVVVFVVVVVVVVVAYVPPIEQES